MKIRENQEDRDKRKKHIEAQKGVEKERMYARSGFAVLRGE